MYSLPIVIIGTKKEPLEEALVLIKQDINNLVQLPLHKEDAGHLHQEQRQA